MSNYYIYPLDNSKYSDSKNPYIGDMLSSISMKYNVVNRNSINYLGIIHGYRYLFNANYFIINWTENIPSRKFGFLQTILFLLLVIIIRVFNKKFIWVFHNKQPHNGSSFLSKTSIYFSIYFSNSIITHAKEGVDFLLKNFGNNFKNKIKYIPHPTNRKSFIKIDKENINYDLIIWGKIEKYKGIAEFLRYASNQNSFKDIKIVICGKCSDSKYLKLINKYKNHNVTIINEYISNDDLSKYIAQAKYILFTYLSDSILSSGSLIQSLYYHTPIIGPNSGAFRDLGEENIISTYNDYKDIISIINNLNYRANKNVLEYIKQNHWNNLIEKIIK